MKAPKLVHLVSLPGVFIDGIEHVEKWVSEAEASGLLNWSPPAFQVADEAAPAEPEAQPEAEPEPAPAEPQPEPEPAAEPEPQQVQE